MQIKLNTDQMTIQSFENSINFYFPASPFNKWPLLFHHFQQIHPFVPSVHSQTKRSLTSAKHFNPLFRPLLRM